MTDFRYIYTRQAAEYHNMIVAEDVENHLLAAIQALCPLDRKHILDLGSGTGRLPLLLASYRPHLLAMDISQAMLLRQQANLPSMNRWHLAQADSRLLPVASGWADIVTAGWSIGHLCGWYPETWKQEIDRVLQEMHRVAAQDCMLIIMETLTTGSLTPAPPTPYLAAYYDWLEAEWGFSRQVISTDYQFKSVEEAVRLTEFFFGSGLSAKISANGWSRLPEWTGVWSKRR